MCCSSPESCSCCRMLTVRWDCGEAATCLLAVVVHHLKAVVAAALTVSGFCCWWALTHRSTSWRVTYTYTRRHNVCSKSRTFSPYRWQLLVYVVGAVCFEPGVV